LILSQRQQELGRLIEHFDVTFMSITSLKDEFSNETKLLLELLSTHLHIPLGDVLLFAGREGEQESRRVYPSLQQWVVSLDARQAVWHAGQVIKAVKKLTFQAARDFNIVAAYHASLVLWAYGVLSLRTGQNKPVGNEIDSSDHSSELVWLDGDDNAQTKRFITLSRGTPCFAAFDRDEDVPIVNHPQTSAVVVKLSNPSDVMFNIMHILKSRGSRTINDTSLPPLVESLNQLMNELGIAARAISQILL